MKALDTLTPLGRGASLLVIGPNGSGKTTLALDAIQGCQKGARIRCVLSSTTQTAEQLDGRLKVGGWAGRLLVAARLLQKTGRSQNSFKFECGAAEAL